ncbi:MAG: DUF5681 domain-containing protein [Aestuariivirga sp.]
MKRDLGDDEGEYHVGFGKPPKHSRFQKGTSGNPTGKGRKKESTALSTLMGEVLAEKMTVTIGGKRRSVTLQEVMVLKLVEKAAQGNKRAIKQLIDLHEFSSLSGDFRPTTIALTRDELRAGGPNWQLPPK